MEQSDAVYYFIAKKRKEQEGDKKTLPLKRAVLGSYWITPGQKIQAFSSAFLNCMLNRITVKDTAKKSAIGSARYTASV